MPIEQLDSFMTALMAQESSGNPNAVNSGTGAHGLYQIMPSNWPSWSKETFGYVAPKTARNQTEVARQKMTQYYNQYGDWDSVAIAWFAGPDAARKYNQGDTSVLARSDGSMTVGEYLEKYKANMGAGDQFNLDPYSGLDLTDVDPDEMVNPNELLLQVFDELTDKLAGGERLDMDDADLQNVPETLAPFDFARSLAGDMVDGTSSAVDLVLSSLGQAGLYAALAEPGDLGVPAESTLDFDPGEVGLSPDMDTGNAAIDIATKYLGIPYKWGGTNPNTGLDCSGLVQLVYKQLGVDLPRVSRDQANSGIEINGLDNARPGDLISFGNPVHHIGIYMGNGKVLHAPRTGRNVSIDKIWENPTSINRVLGGDSNSNRPGGGTTNVQSAPNNSGQGGGSGQPVFQTIANVATGGQAVQAPQVAPPRNNRTGGTANRPM